MSTPILTASGLCRHFEVKAGLFGATNTVRALDGASFELFPGQTLAVVGESGCGKSTLANLITMIDTPSAGTFAIDGKTVKPGAELSDKELRAKVQIVFQNPYGSLNPRQTVGKMLMEPLLLNRKELSAADREQRVLETMDLVGLRPEHFNRYPHMFSGGQRQRIAVARALMLEPEILVLDEPVSALDLSIQSQVLNLLIDLQDKFNLAYLFISHDLSVVRHFADAVIVMYLGKPVEQGLKDEVFENPRHPYTRALLSATPMADPTRRQTRIKLEGELPSPLNVPLGCAFNPRCWKATEECRTNRPEMSAGKHGFACFHPED